MPIRELDRKCAVDLAGSLNAWRDGRTYQGPPR